MTIFNLIQLDDYIVHFIDRMEGWQVFIILLIMLANKIFSTYVPSPELRIIRDTLNTNLIQITSQLHKLIDLMGRKM